VSELDQEIKAIASPTPMERHRFHLLDAMRGIAAILVVLYHVPVIFKHSLDFPNSFLAVDFFFCLSGFVIAFSYEQRLRDHLNFRDFMVVRLTRLYPLFALGLAIGIVRAIFLAHLVSRIHWPAFLSLIGISAALIPNFFFPAASILLFPLDHPAWSLFYELIANAVYAVILRRHIARIGLPLVCLASLVALIAITIWHSSLDFHGAMPDSWIGLPRVGFSFIAGVLLFHLLKRQGENRLSGPVSWISGAIAVALLFAALTATSAWTRTGPYQASAIILLFPALVYFGARCTLPAALNHICAALGDASYPLYIIHAPLMLPSFYGNPPHLIVKYSHALPYFLIPYLGFLVFLSWWLGHSFDAPVRKRLTRAYKSFIAKQPALSTQTR
jgi:peptidoglycan/LPS O-acetylase OafA/YrhL